VDVIFRWVILWKRLCYRHSSYITWGASFEFSLPIPSTSTNNQAEYEVVLKGIKLLREIKADAAEIFGDSMLVVNQLIGKYDCNDDILRIYHEECLELLI
jgi:ribonuclease HI